MAETIDSVDGEVIAAPTPWTARARIKNSMVGEAPAIIEPITNTVTPAMKMRLRPTWSPMRPQVTINEAKTSA